MSGLNSCIADDGADGELENSSYEESELQSEISRESSFSLLSDSDEEESSCEFCFQGREVDISRTQDRMEGYWLSHDFCDFLSDFGRNESFLLDGDALIMHALSNKYLDWRNGGQFLHLIYIIEHFLASLWIRGAQFDIFFLFDNDVIFQHIGPSYDLARNILIHHLRSHETGANYPLKLHLVAGSWFSANNPESVSTMWQDFVTSYRPAFILTNNESAGKELSSIALRWFCHQQLLEGYCVVVLENITFDGARVRGFLYKNPDSSTSQRFTSYLEALKVHILKAYGSIVPNQELFKSTRIIFERLDSTAQRPTLRLTDLFVESIRAMLSREGCSTLIKGLTAIGCACFHISRSWPLSARVLVLPGDAEQAAAMDEWGGSRAIPIAVSAFLSGLYSAMAFTVRRAIVQDANVNGGSLTDAFDGRLFTALLLSTIAAGGALPDNLSKASNELLLSSWPLSSGQCPPLAELLRPLAADPSSVSAARDALDRAAELRDSLQPAERAALLPVGGILLKEVMGDLAARMAAHETADPLKPSGAGPFSAHHYHSTRPLEDEPDSFSYGLRDSAPSRRPPARRSEYSIRKQERRRLRQMQLKAKAASRYQESLLAGSPCQRQVIAQRLSPAEAEERRRRAVEALQADGGLPRGAADKERAADRKAGGRQAAAVKVTPSKKDKIVQKNTEDQRLKRFATEMEGFENYKRQLSELERKSVEEYLSKLEELAKKSETIGLQVRQHCLQTAVARCSAARRQRVVFLIAQRILREHLPELDRALVAAAVLSVGFKDLHDALLGTGTRARARSGSQESRSYHSSIRFQLVQVPEHLARPVGDVQDRRVQFPPDTWQRRLLDVVDSGNSALVVAPTASGKTFISYYVMEMCLRAGDEGVVVYVAPTKALVNQVRAEIDARFDKHYSRGARKVSATFTRDFRDDNMLNAQIIVTVPACLGILLLSTPVWASSIRHVILDEVHCLGESGGEVWEQLILLIDSPFVALSATLGNVPRFHAWLSKVEATRGREVILVDHHERYNDLSHWIWTRDKVVPLNPCWVVQKMRSGRPIEPSMFPKDLRFLPEHCVALYDAMAEHMPLEERRELDPEVFFRKLCSESKLLWALSMRQAAAWEAALKRALCSLEPKAQDHVLEGLTADTEDAFQRVDKELAMSGDRDYVLAQITSLLQHLKKSDMLPCICFLLERHGCEKLALQVTSNLWKMEARHRQDSGWAGERDKLVAALKEAKQLKTWFKRNRDCSVYTLPSGDRLRRGDAYGRYDEARRSLHRLLEPNAQFAIKIVSNEEIEDAFGNLSDGQHWTSLVSPGLRAALRRGIGIHHAGMPLKYRQVVERLFRAKRLGVVFATSTLALGINMPAKTSVFIRDAIYLNAMSFRQMAGRAGRRGFDLRGHVVFLALPSSKCLRLMRSGLPTLQGNLVLNNSMALRLIIRQSSLAQARPRSESVDDRDSPYHRSIRACWRLVNLPLFDPMALSGAGLMGQQMAHTFRFSLEYLQRAGLVHVDSSGEMAPNDLAAFVAHLFFMEPSNFAFVSLLVAEDGLLFRRMCKPGPQRDEKVLSVLCHLFGRKLLPKNLAAWARRRDSTSGPSTVLLPDLSCIGDCVETAGRDQGVLEGELVQRLLQQSNDEALRLLVAYCSCFAAVHGDQLGDDDTLPVTACRPSATVPAGEASEASAGLLVCPDLERLVLPRRVRSIFVALSGHGDRFGSVRELCATLRAGLYLDPQMLPLFELYDADMPLNAYLLDFFKHGQWTALVRYNKIRQEVLWDDLHSFELVLRAIHAAMARRSVLARAEGRETPFDDDDVLATLESISTRFSQAVRAAGA